MGITDFFSDLMSSWTQEVHAEAPEEDKEESEDGGKDTGDGEGESSGEKEEEGGDEAAEEGEEEAEEEDAEEEEEEIEDPKPKLEEECIRSSQCSSFKHHYEECVERVTGQHEDPDYKGPKEDCVEEFFHLQHCATQCAAGRLFKILK